MSCTFWLTHVGAIPGQMSKLDKRLRKDLPTKSRLWDFGAQQYPEEQFNDHLVASWAVSQLKAKHEKPFFMAIGFYRPHVPFYAPQRFFEKFPLDKVRLPATKDDDRKDLPEAAVKLTDNGAPPSHEWFKQSGSWRAAVRAYYSSVCGGRSGSAMDAWASTGTHAFNAVPPLGAHNRPFACQDAPLYRWTRTRAREELGARLRAWGENRGRKIRTIAGVREIQIARRAVTGRPARYAITDSQANTFELSAEDLRLACNYPAPGYPRPTDDHRVMSNDMEFAIRGSTLQITGRGFGHGVGMCQYCAYGMAEAGASVETMLERFFPGAAIERVY